MFTIKKIVSSLNSSKHSLNRINMRFFYGFDENLTKKYLNRTYFGN